MKKNSTFKDYYDYMQGIYGIDNKIIYKRDSSKLLVDLYNKKIVENKYSSSIQGKLERKYLIDKDGKSASFFTNKNDIITVKEEKKILFFCGQMYSILKLVFTDSKNNSKEKLEINKEYNSKYSFVIEHLKTNGIVSALIYGYKIDEGNKHFRTYELMEYNPNLGALNFILMMSPELAYQEIEQYLSDFKSNEKICEVDNKNKILQAGFDLKTSFRKSKNQNKK